MGADEQIYEEAHQARVEGSTCSVPSPTSSSTSHAASCWWWMSGFTPKMPNLESQQTQSDRYTMYLGLQGFSKFSRSRYSRRSSTGRVTGVLSETWSTALFHASSWVPCLTGLNWIQWIDVFCLRNLLLVHGRKYNILLVCIEHDLLAENSSTPATKYMKNP